MAKVQRYSFSYREIAETLIKQQGIHEGLWGVFLDFGLEAANVRPPAGSEGDFFPTAIVPVQSIGIQRFRDGNYLTVDAALVNPVAGQPDESRDLLSTIRQKRKGKP